MINNSKLAGAFKFPKSQNLMISQLYDLISIFVNFGYSISIEPQEDFIQIDVFEGERFENRPLPFGEEE